MRILPLVFLAMLCATLSGEAIAQSHAAQKQAADARYNKWVAERRTSETRSVPMSGSVTRDLGGWKEEVTWQSRPAEWPFEHPDRNGNITFEQRRLIPPPNQGGGGGGHPGRHRPPRRHCGPSAIAIGIGERYVQSQRVWVPERWEWVPREVWIPERWDTVYVPPVYRQEVVNGQVVVIVVQAARYDRVFVPGYWDVVWDRVWIPGYWQEVR